MENIVTLAIPVLVALLLIRVLILPVRLTFKLLANSGCGLLCLWLLNSVAAFTGVFFPINAVTVLIAGFWGLPGIAALAVAAVV